MDYRPPYRQRLISSWSTIPKRIWRYCFFLNLRRNENRRHDWGFPFIAAADDVFVARVGVCVDGCHVEQQRHVVDLAKSFAANARNHRLTSTRFFLFFHVRSSGVVFLFFLFYSGCKEYIKENVIYILLFSKKKKKNKKIYLYRRPILRQPIKGRIFAASKTMRRRPVEGRDA